MHERAMTASATDRRWPMTDEAWRALVEETARLRTDVETLAGRAPATDGVIDLPVAKAARRLEQLTAVLDGAAVDDEPGRAVIGRRVTFREQDGEAVTYALAYPGDGDPTQGWISVDSPLGAALLGRRVGEHAEVQAPAGRRIVTILRIE